MVSLLTALGGLAIPATAIIIFLIVLVLVLAVIWGGFEFEGGYGKFALKLKKRDKNSVVASPSRGDVPTFEEPQVLPPPPPAKEIEAQATPPEDKQDEGDKRTNAWHDFFRADTVSELDAAYALIKASLEECEDEFWVTEYKERRANLGADNGADAVQNLIVENPTWSYPFAVLIKWAIRDHDYEAAESLLNDALKRQTSEQFGIILSCGVKLKYLTRGAEEALRFCVDYVKTSIPERMKASAFYTLAEQLKGAGHIEGHRVALEWAVALQPSDKGKVFSLAYNYSEDISHWVPAMWHYRGIINQDHDGPVARNNLGILVGNFDKAAQIEAYEKAAESGDLYAPANLANLLISDGYIAAAERMLKTVEEPGDAAELHSRAAAAAMAARRNLKSKDEEIQRTVEQASQCYRASLARSLKRLQSDGEAASGFYGTSDNMVSASIGPNAAEVRIRLGTTDYFGHLAFQTTCFAGAVSNHSDTILGTYYIDVTLLDEGDGIVRLFQWPRAIGFDHQIGEYELRKIEGVPPPPPPLPPPSTPEGLGNALTSALLDNRRTT